MGQWMSCFIILVHLFVRSVRLNRIGALQQWNWQQTTAAVTQMRMVFIWLFCIISMICLQGNRIKGWKSCRESVNRLEMNFVSLPHQYLVVHLYWMLLYDILLYKHVFQNVLMYALYLYHAVCYLVFPFIPFFLPLVPDLYHFYSPALRFFHLSAFFCVFFVSTCPGRPALLLRPRHDHAQTIREKYSTYPMTAVPGYLVTRAYQGRYQRSLFPLLYDS